MTLNPLSGLANGNASLLNSTGMISHSKNRMGMRYNDL
jgi:hypothetical protein